MNIDYGYRFHLPKLEQEKWQRSEFGLADLDKKRGWDDAPALSSARDVVTIIDRFREGVASDDGCSRDLDDRPGYVKLVEHSSDSDPKSTTVGRLASGPETFDGSWLTDYSACHWPEGVLERSWWRDPEGREHYGLLRNDRITQDALQATEVIIDRARGNLTVLEQNWDSSPL